MGGFDWNIKHPRTKNGRYELRYERRDSDSYMDSETHETWTLIDLEQGDGGRELKEWYGKSMSDSRGTTERGATSVAFSDDDKLVIVKNYDGTIEEFAMPGPGRNRDR